MNIYSTQKSGKENISGGIDHSKMSPEHILVQLLFIHFEYKY